VEGVFLKKTGLVILAFLGTLAAALIVAVAYGHYLFHLQVETEIDSLLNRARQSPADPVDWKKLKHLSDPVRRYFHFALVDRGTYVRSASLMFSGLCRTRPDKPWLPIEGRQVLCAVPPGFVRTTSMTIAPAVWVKGRDRYMDRRGSSIAKFFSVIDLADDEGEPVDRSQLLRFLSEAVWMPTVLLPGKNVHWEPIDESSAKIVIDDGANRAAARVTFDADGRILRITTEDRHRKVDGTFQRTGWSGIYRNYKTIQGVRVPTEMETVWHLDSGTFSYEQFFLSSVEYDRRR
jgi:hypothetical protein